MAPRRRCGISSGRGQRQSGAWQGASAPSGIPVEARPRLCRKERWTLPYRRWLTTLRFDHPAQQVVLQDYIHCVHDAEERIARLTKQIEDLAPTWSMAPVVEAVQQCAAWPWWRLSSSSPKSAISPASAIHDK